MERFSHLVVGAGFAGSVCAERLASAGKSVLLIDQRSHIGGNAYDYYDEAGILVHKYGAHCFHSNNQAVVDYLSRFTEWRPYTHRVLSSVNGQLLPVPINLTTLKAFQGDEAAARAAMVEPYTRKQWGPYADELASTVLARIKTRDTDDDRYFTDTFQAMPAHGYTRMFDRMLASPKIKILLKTSYREIAGALPYPMETIYTGPIDEFFAYQFGPLPYRSARFTFQTYRSPERWLPAPVVNFPSADVAYTRRVEFKQLTGQQHPETTIGTEYPSAEGEPYWPVPTDASAARYKQYEALAKQLRTVHFVGRLGTYKYLDMHAVVAQALKLSQSLLQEESVCLQSQR